MARKKINKKQEEIQKRMKKTRQVDSVNLRLIIEGKLKWVNTEIIKGKKQIETIKTQINRLEGIQLFINDLLLPPIKKKNKRK